MVHEPRGLVVVTRTSADAENARWLRAARQRTLDDRPSVLLRLAEPMPLGGRRNYLMPPVESSSVKAALKKSRPA